MKTEKTNVKSEAVFSDDGKHRLLLHREWDKSKPSAMVIMINPNAADMVNCDTTTMLVMNNLNRLGYGSFDIVNLYTKITSKIAFRFCSDEELLSPDNDKIIQKSAEKADTIIVAWGSVGRTNQRIKARQKAVIEILAPYSEKLCQIGEKGYHPLTPSVRNNWELFEYQEDFEDEEDNGNEPDESGDTAEAESIPDEEGGTSDE